MPVKQPVIIDYIIVGQGLAGSAVAMQLLKRGKQILVIDEPQNNHASRPAAGLFNPVTGRNAVKTWLADELFPFLHEFYREVEYTTGKKFFSPTRLYRPFASVQEQNEWMGKSADDVYAAYVEKVETNTIFTEGVKDHLGGIVLKQCGYMNTEIYLDAVREYVKARGHLLVARFNENELTIDTNKVTYNGFSASAVIFCQGVGAGLSKRFKALPIKPLKGEIITIKSDWKKDVILNRGVYMVPGSFSGEYRVGSTYKFNDSSPGATEAGRRELEEKLNELIDIPYEVIGQEWGVRPTTPDRRPLLGNYPESDRLIIFNGLGTKGVSLAPYFSEVLIRWIEKTGSLNKDVALTRFK
jgi:glycine/D-amino acid oxidase-like deaminating enzyme